MNQELTSLEEERNKLKLEAKKWAEKRNTIHEKIRNFRKEASSIKEKRDTLNLRVQGLKNIRDKIKIRRQEKRDKISDLLEKIRALDIKKPEGNMWQVEKEIEKIDWKIQTTPLPLKEEHNLVRKVEQLESQLSVQKKTKKLRERLLELRSKEKSLGIEAKTLHGKLSELAEQSQKFHEQMHESFNKAHELQVEADNFHKKYVETKQKAQKLHQKCVKVVGKIRTIEQDVKEKEDKKQAERQSEIQKELEKRALAKLKRGEKLIWEEFQILAEKGML
jgi:phosphoserine phosphatase